MNHIDVSGLCVRERVFRQNVKHVVRTVTLYFDSTLVDIPLQTCRVDYSEEERGRKILASLSLLNIKVGLLFLCKNKRLLCTGTRSIILLQSKGQRLSTSVVSTHQHFFMRPITKTDYETM